MARAPFASFLHQKGLKAWLVGCLDLTMQLQKNQPIVEVSVHKNVD